MLNTSMRYLKAAGRGFSVLALGATGLMFLPMHGKAATIDITGVAYSGFPGYGSGVDKHNVVGYNASGIAGASGGGSNGWRVQGGSAPSMVLSNLANYAVDWYFSGAESGDKIEFRTPGLIPYTETNQNNNNTPGNDPGWRRLGTTTASSRIIPFQVIDLTKGSGLANGTNNVPGAFVASLMFAYLTPRELDNRGEPKKWRISRSPTDWFVFGFDDPGSSNNDHDDYVGIGHVYAIAPTPLPGALPLMATVMTGAAAFGQWRRRRRSGGAGRPSKKV